MATNVSKLLPESHKSALPYSGVAQTENHVLTRVADVLSAI